MATFKMKWKKIVIKTNYASFKMASKHDSKLSTFNFDFTIEPLQKVCLQKIVEGTND